MKHESVAHVLRQRLWRTGTSLAPSHREADPAKFNSDFVTRWKAAGGNSKDDLWLELPGGCRHNKAGTIKPLRGEIDELIALVAP